jgi:FtsP/CotA-like multicopper oxidase with cupredoxin domain
VLFLQGSAPHSLPTVEPNDNRSPRGTFAGDSLVVSLEVRMATWYPENPGGAHVDLAAFAETGRAPEIPGPLIRVRAGTTIIATLSNTLADSTVTFRGFFSRPAVRDSGVALRPGERRTVRFAAGQAGTYFYEAEVGKQSDEVEREQLAGAFIIDPPGGSPPDRVLVLNIWSGMLDSVNGGNALAINGRSWPHTERIRATVGDSIRWRVINPTVRVHPMHLHGVYFRLDSRGTIDADTSFAGDSRLLLVTNSMLPGTTMSIAWRPDRPGNWLFHCHLMFHALAEARLGIPEAHSAHSGDPDKHMAGLVLGIQADPRPGDPVEVRKNPRKIRLETWETPARGRSPRRLGFSMVRGASRPGDTVSVPGPLLVLTRGQPTDITVRNRLPEATAVHWHGIELESWSDGVPGWSGMGDRRAPAIAPGDSFTARLTLPRAGTFMYHTHLNDIEQITSGMYGPIVVLEPGKRFDPSTDHLFLVSWDSPDNPPRRLVNGDSLPLTETLRAGVTHRFRFINIGPAAGARFSIRRDTTLQRWAPAARDGAELPRSRRGLVPAMSRIDVGEIADFEFRPEMPGEYRLMLGPQRVVRTYIAK